MRKLGWRVAAVMMAVAVLATACGGDDDDGEEDAATTAAGEAAAPATFKFRPLDAGGPITKTALRQGDVQVALLFSSDADIAENDWVVLEDDKELQQIENLTPAIRTDKRTDAIADALDAVSAKLTTEELIEMNRLNTVEGKEPDVVAKEWLEDNDLLPYEGTKATGRLTVGSTNFAEQEIVAELYAQVLESAGVQITRRFQLGNREIVAPALEKGDIDLYPEYLGTYLLFVDESTTVPADKAAAAAELNELLESKGITMLAPSDAQNTNAFVVTKETAEKYDLATVSDLARVPDSLTLGGPPECPTRPFCLVGLKEIYGLRFE